MADLNRVVCTGRLTKELPAPTTNGTTESVFFTIACNGYKKEDTSFIPCRAWGQSAKYLHQYARKGNLLGIDGQIKTYQTKQGTLSWYVNITTVVNYQKSNESSNAGNYGYTAMDTESSEDTYAVPNDFDEDDVPF